MRKYESKLVASSRLIADMLVNDIGQDQERFNEMFGLALLDRYPLSMRASRIVALCAEKYPALVTSSLPLLFNKLAALKVDGVRRGFLKILAELPLSLDEEQTGILADLAFTWLEDPKESVAVRYYSMEILLHICLKFPELSQELLYLLKNLHYEGTPGIVSRSRAIIKELENKGFTTL